MSGFRASQGGCNAEVEGLKLKTDTHAPLFPPAASASEGPSSLLWLAVELFLAAVQGLRPSDGRFCGMFGLS